MGKQATSANHYIAMAAVPGSYVIDQRASPLAQALKVLKGPKTPDEPNKPPPPPEEDEALPMPDPEDELEVQRKRRAAAARRRSGRSSTLLSENSSLGG